MNDSFSLKKLNNLLFLIPFALLSFVSSAFKTSGKNDNVRRRSLTEVMQVRQDVAGYAQNFVGIRYRHAGTSPRTGFDCSGFTSYILNEFDVKVSPSSANQSSQGLKIPLENVQPGDLIFFGHRGRVSHVALVVECTADGILCVHATNSRGIMVENVTISEYWQKKILFARDVITPQMLN